MKKFNKTDIKIPVIVAAVVAILAIAVFIYSNYYAKQISGTETQNKPEEQPEGETTKPPTQEKPTAENATNATEVKKENPCNVKPEITMSPQSISLAPNAKATFVAVVKNTEGLGCSPALFVVEARAPTNWEVKLFSSSYTLQWGDIGRTRIEVRSNITASPRNYTITAVVKNLNSNLTAETTSTYTITSQTSTTGTQTISGQLGLPQ